MPLDFPSNPVNGQVYDNYYYDATMGTWRAQGSGAALNTFVNPTITNATIDGLTLIQDLPVSMGGTGASDATAARTNLAITPANIGAQPAGSYAASSHTHAASDISSGQLASARMPAGTVVGFNRIRTSARSAYGFNGDVIISDLNISITPKFSNSLLLVQWQVMYEADYNSVFRVYRDGGLVYTSGYQGYNENDGNTWSGIASLQYDTDVASTPSNQMIQYFVPAGSTNATTLQLAVRQSNNAGATFYLNRSVNSAGTGAYEIGVSTAVIWEIAQ